MSLWNNQTPPVLYPDAVATNAGWAHPVTGELLVCVTGLSTYKNEGAGTQLVNARILGAKAQGADPIVHKKIFAAGDVIVVEAIFLEPVTKTGGTPTMAININGNSRTFTQFTDPTNFDAKTKDKVTGFTISAGGSGYLVGDKLTFTGGGGSSAEAVVATVSSGAITGITLLAGGSGYTSAPTVGGGTGTGATIVAKLGSLANGPGTNRWLFGYTVASNETATSAQIIFPSSITGVFDTTEDALGASAAGTAVIGTGVTSVTVSAGGSGYTSAPKVSFTGGTPTTPATAVAVLDQSVGSIAVTAGGSGYTSAPTVTFTGGGGSSSVATAVLASSGSIKSITITNGGTGGTNGTGVAVSITGGGGTGATATATIAGGVVTVITITAGGSGYTSAPTVSVTGQAGSPVYAPVIGKVVASVTVGTPGSGYTSAPTIGFTGGSGSGATATATMATLTDVLAVTVTNPGVGYTGTPTVSFTPQGGGAAATISVLGGTEGSGNVTGVTITNGGTLYTTAPSVTTTSGGSGVTFTAVLTGGVVTSVTFSGTGTGYTNGDALIFTGGLAGSGATATATTAGAVESVTITNGGSGYWNVPTVAFSGGSGTGAAGTAVVSHGKVTSVTMTNPGTGYTGAPTVAFTEPSSAVTNPTFNGTPSAAGYTVNGVAPTITAAAISGYQTGTTFVTNNIVTLTLTTSVPVYVTGSPYITLEINSNPETASYVNGSGTTTLIFQYEVQASDFCTATEFTITSPVVLNSGTMTDFQGNALVLTFTAPTVTAVVVNSPLVPSFTAAAVTGGPAYTTSGTVTITLTANVNATVVTTNGTPYIELYIGSSVQHATYASGTGTTSLVFTYTVGSGDVATPRAFSIGSQIFLAGGTIQNASAVNFPAFFTAPDTSEDTVNSGSIAAWASSAMSGFNSGTAYITGNNITLTLTASENATVSTANGTPYIELYIGNATRFAIYTSGSGTTALVFKYTALSTDSAVAKTFSTGDQILFNGGSIVDGSSNHFPEDFIVPATSTITVN
jgi:hypothetical protein